MEKKKLKHYKVGLDSETYKISMVSEPAISVDYVALSKENQIKLSSDERHICYGPALIPNLDIYRNNGQTEYYLSFSEESIVKMSQEFMKNYRQHEVNLQHEDDVDEVYVCESWLVEDPYKDKANFLGFNVPRNTWMIAMKVNNIDTWERVKSGELRGFSCEAAVSLEDFSKAENNNDNFNDMNDEMLFSKLTNWMKDFFKKEETISVKPEKAELTKEEELAMQSGFTNVEDYRNEVEAIKEELEEQTPNEAAETPTDAPKTEEPTTTPTVDEKAPEEPKNAPEEKDNHLEELVNSLKAEIEALKGLNKDLNSKVKKLENEPSVKPVSTVGKPSKGDTYSAWREQMRGLIG